MSSAEFPLLIFVMKLVATNADCLGNYLSILLETIVSEKSPFRLIENS